MMASGLFRRVAAGLMFLACGTATAQAAGTLVIAIPANQEPATLDGHIDPFQSTWLVDSLMADPLLVLAPDGTYKPDLALAWESNPAGTVWTFKLRPGVTFQDGTPFNAAAVKANLERIIDPKTQSAQMKSEVGPIKSVDVVDDLTVRVGYDTPWVTLLDAMRRVPIWSPTAMEKAGLNGFASVLVGAGPFTFVRKVPNDRVDLKKWPGYGGWNSVQKKPGAVELDGVSIRWIGSSSVLGSLVQSGDADVATFLDPISVPDYKDNKAFQFYAKDQAGTGLQFVMNIRKPPLDDIRVRQALITGSDRPGLNTLLYDGLFAVGQGPLNDVHPCYWRGAETMYPYNPTKAGQLLDQAGWVLPQAGGMRVAKGVKNVADGTPLRIRMTMISRKEMGEGLQAQFKQLGIDFAVEVVPGPVQLDRVQKREFDLIYERQRSPDPVILDQIWNSKWEVPGGWAWTGFKDAAFDALVGQLRTVPDFAKRCEIARDVQKTIMENALMLPTLSDPVYVAMSPKVKGWETGAEGNWFYVNNVTK